MYETEELIKTSYGAHNEANDTKFGYYDFKHEMCYKLILDIDGVCVQGSPFQDWSIVRPNSDYPYRLIMALRSVILPPGETLATLNALLRTGPVMRIRTADKVLVTFETHKGNWDAITLPPPLTESNMLLYNFVHVYCHGRWLECATITENTHG